MYKICSCCFIVLTAGFVSGKRTGQYSLERKHEESSINVINGTPVPITKFPYMVSYKSKGIFTGSGVIIDKKWILTTAYNVYGMNISDLEFRVGSNKYNGSGQVLNIEKVITHEHFKMGSWDNDIAVVKVKPIRFGRKVKLIALGTKDLKGGSKAVVSGWGQQNSTTVVSDVLLAANVTVLDWKTCNNTFRAELTPRMMCTFDKNVGPCARDFGDPLVVNNAVYGLYCGGRGCTPGRLPVLYSDVPALYDWIEKTISTH